MSAAVRSPATDGWPRLRLPGLLVLLAVAGLHLLLLLWAQRALHMPHSPAAPAQAPLVLVWVPPLAPVPQALLPPRETPAPRPARRPAQPSIGAEPAAAQPEPAASAAMAAPVAAEVAASAPAGGLLDSDDSRRAIRDVARQRSTGELGALATSEKAALSEPDKMGQEIARGARGDCLKGEYAGAGMGLLSLPFWLIAELRDKCRR